MIDELTDRMELMNAEKINKLSLSTKAQKQKLEEKNVIDVEIEKETYNIVIAKRAKALMRKREIPLKIANNESLMENTKAGHVVNPFANDSEFDPHNQYKHNGKIYHHNDPITTEEQAMAKSSMYFGENSKRNAEFKGDVEWLSDTELKTHSISNWKQDIFFNVDDLIKLVDNNIAFFCVSSFGLSKRIKSEEKYLQFEAFCYDRQKERDSLNNVTVQPLNEEQENNLQNTQPLNESVITKKKETEPLNESVKRIDLKNYSTGDLELIDLLWKQRTVKRNDQLETRDNVLKIIGDNKNNTLRLRNLYKKLLEDGYIYKRVGYFAKVEL
ncbi:MAG: Unknown protein [uncultured Sulfurovum sp.]|uniref:Uncharacterized protein n=1 Tax=uncultured Sulfurovum sp. TaxID=269237 RepID=A0A6S6SGF2_9BACT|nr:MAG: Unknown protein [uncultured Sulfurovum sp.]